MRLILKSENLSIVILFNLKFNVFIMGCRSGLF